MEKEKTIWQQEIAEGYCDVRETGTHCHCWWDDCKPCCACGHVPECGDDCAVCNPENNT